MKKKIYVFKVRRILKIIKIQGKLLFVIVIYIFVHKSQEFCGLGRTPNEFKIPFFFKWKVYFLQLIDVYKYLKFKNIEYINYYQVYKSHFFFSTVRLKWGHRFSQFKFTSQSEIFNVCLRRPQRGRGRGHEIFGNGVANYGWFLQRSSFSESMDVHIYRK